MSHHRSNSLEINMESGGEGGGNELEAFLLQQRDKDNNNSLSGFFSKVGTNVKKFVPKRIGGAGTIEDDIAVRFGMFSGLSSSSANGSGVGSAAEDTSCLSRFKCGYTLVRMRTNSWFHHWLQG